MPATNRTRLWVNENGRVICGDHGGSYLRSAITAHPHARQHRTPLDHWYVEETGLVGCEECPTPTPTDPSPRTSA